MIIEMEAVAEKVTILQYSCMFALVVTMSRSIVKTIQRISFTAFIKCYYLLSLSLNLQSLSLSSLFTLLIPKVTVEMTHDTLATVATRQEKVPTFLPLTRIPRV